MNQDTKFETELAALLRDLVTEFIAHPQDLEIVPKRFSTIISIAWRGNRADISRMIGTKGDTYRPLAALMRLIGEQHGYEVDLERVGDPLRGVMERYQPFKLNLLWPRDRIMQLLERTARQACRHSQVELEAGDLRADTTAIKVGISKAETMKTETVLRETLKHIFKVIGNANGRKLMVEVSRCLEPEAPQPATARGRFANERK
jgi:predicted RNA-binding protein YlqC (UPF0109 family)